MASRTCTEADDPESGRILLLSLGCVVLGLMIVAMVVASTAVHLDRKRLLNLADLAAVHAVVVQGGPGVFGVEERPDYLPLTASGVERAAQASLEANVEFGAGHLSQVRVVQATTPDGMTAEVTLTAVTNPPLIGWFTDAFLDGIDLSATSRARSQTH